MAAIDFKECAGCKGTCMNVRYSKDWATLSDDLLRPILMQLVAYHFATRVEISELDEQFTVKDGGCQSEIVVLMEK